MLENVLGFKKVLPQILQELHEDLPEKLALDQYAIEYTLYNYFPSILSFNLGMKSPGLSLTRALV